jgi:hypothetical protein
MDFKVIVDSLLDEMDEQAPGLVEGFYLVGSVALGAYRAGRSDIDFVAIIAPGCGEPQFAALRRGYEKHMARYPRPFLDGIFLTWDELEAGSDALSGPRPVVSEAGFSVSDQSGLINPVTWHILAHHGVRCRGPRPHEFGLRTDAIHLANWTLANLDQYWTPYIERHGRVLSRHGMWSLRPWFTEWTALGVCRLHYTLATGQITTKLGAGRHALKTFPRKWHGIIEEARGLHDGGASSYQNPFRRRSDCLDFARMVIADAKQVATAH